MGVWKGPPGEGAAGKWKDRAHSPKLGKEAPLYCGRRDGARKAVGPPVQRKDLEKEQSRSRLAPGFPGREDGHSPFADPPHIRGEMQFEEIAHTGEKVKEGAHKLKQDKRSSCYGRWDQLQSTDGQK